MITVYVIAALFVGAPFCGQALRWHDQVKARRIAEEERICAPLPVERVELTEPWPTRQTPMAHDNDAPIVWREGLFVPDLSWSLLKLEVEDDFTTCLEPCTAKHCAIHSGLSGCDYIDAQAETQAVHLSWNTKTAEWSVSLLGLTVPDFPEVRSPLYAEVAT